MKNFLQSSTGKKLKISLVEGDLTKPLIIFVHGFAGGMWEPQYKFWEEFFQKNDYPICKINFSFAFHNLPKTVENVSIDSYKKEVVSLLKYIRDLGFKKYVLVGHSLGAGLILDIEAHQKTGAACIIAVNPYIKFDPARMAESKIGKMVAEKGFYKIRRWLRSRKILKEAEAELSAFDIMKSAQLVKAPVMFINGVRDRVTPLAVTEEFASNLWGSSKVLKYPFLAHTFFHKHARKGLRMISKEMLQWIVDHPAQIY